MDLGLVIPVLRRAANPSKWTDEQQTKLTRQLRYRCGKEENSTISIKRLEQLIPPRRNVLPKHLFSLCRTQVLRHLFCVNKGQVSMPAPRRAIMTNSRCIGFIKNCEKERNALRQMTGQRGTQQYPQSWGNVALADESLGILQTPKTKTRSLQLSAVHDIKEEEVEIEALAPTTGIINGIRLSLTLWSLIGLIILLMR
jgi:hypothetical protein